MASSMREEGMPHSNLDHYILQGGTDGGARLKILAEALAPSTKALLMRLGPLSGLNIVDAACGGGDVSLLLAEFAGPQGQVTGFDLDAQLLSVASTRAAQHRHSRLRFMVADVTKPWLVDHADLAYARFILTHLANPQDVLAQAHAALKSQGRIAIEDIDADGMFWDPPSPAMKKLVELYVTVSKARGGNPFIGRTLGRLLREHGFTEVKTAMLHAYGTSGPAKMSPVLIAPAIAEQAVALGVIGKTEMDALTLDVLAYGARPDTEISMPRVFQAWGIKPSS
jgi:SAM-dependent methyltransferase